MLYTFQKVATVNMHQLQGQDIEPLPGLFDVKHVIHIAARHVG